MREKYEPISLVVEYTTLIHDMLKIIKIFNSTQTTRLQILYPNFEINRGIGCWLFLPSLG